MGKNSRLIGIILIISGILVFLGCSLVSIISSMEAEGSNIGGVILGIVISLVVAIPLVGGGVYLLFQSRSEAAEQVEATRQRKILDMVKTRGQINISDLVIELKSSSNQVRQDIYKIVGMGLLKGYVNWDEGVLYSQEASQLKGRETCPNCGGELRLAGTGVITCPYCGSEIFL
jgi:hypothetical protein